MRGFSSFFMKTAHLTLAATLSLLAAPLLQSAEKKPAAPAAKPAAKPAAPAAPAAPGAPGFVPDLSPKGSALPETVAVVEGTEIKRQELEEAFASMLSRQGASPDAVPEDQRSQVYHMILDNLIVTHIIEKRSKDVAVPEEEVTATLDKIKAKFGSEDEMKKQVESNGQTMDGVKADIRGSLRQQKWVDSQIKDSKPVTDEDAQKFYQENPDQFKKPEEVRASHILIAVPEDAKPEEVVKKEKAAQAAAARVKGGEDFAKVAKELSEDPGSKENGGDLDFFTKDRMVPEFADAAFALKKDAISDPVRSKFGYHIIKVTDRKDAEAMTLDSVKPQLLAYLQRQKRQEEVNKVLTDVRATAEVKISLP